MTDSYLLFMIFRILTAVVSGTLVSISMTYAEDIAEGPAVAKVISGVFAGFSIASVFGVPIATAISNALGWRAVFFCIFGATLLLLAVLFRVLPRQSSLHAQSALSQFLLFKDKKITCGCAIVFLGGVSVYTFYTYLTPILETELHIPESWISAGLLVFGVAALISNIASGSLAARSGLRSLPVVYVFQTILLLLLTLATKNTVTGGVVIFFIGVSMYLLNSPLQLHFLETASREHPSCVNLASSLISVFFNFGIAAGSALGGVIVENAGLSYVGLGGAVPAAAAALFAVALLKMTKTENP